MGWYRLSLRSRMVLLTAAIVTAVVAAGGVLIVAAVEAELLEDADDVAIVRADEVAELVATGSAPTRLPTTEVEAVVQVVSGGQLVAATSNVAEARAFDLPAQDPGTTQVMSVDVLPIDDTGPFRVVAHGMLAPEGPVTIFVAVPVDDIVETLAAATRVGAVGLAVLVLVLCALMWWLIGRTLAPVDEIRVRADRITGRRLDARVPEPAQLDEIGRLARTVNAMLARLESSAEHQRRFVADAAHELRSPVASLRTQLETAAETSRYASDSLVPDLLHETLRMQVVIEQLLLLARADNDTLRRAWAVVDLDETVDTVVSGLPAARKVGISVRGVHPVQVEGDRDLLELVVRNLIGNAVRHARRQVEVGLAAEDGVAVLTVDDDGAGIPDERRVEIFRRFSRLDTSRARDDGGVGLGLAIVTSILDAHGGSVAVDRAPAGGARFCVRLPLATPVTAAVGSGDELLRATGASR
ncbi:MAG: HAMP domain-containing histidine kinase [Actinomycetota bacterium]|nr:HAMP domain-containing histidine kinase [Actinomycetota bacterium]